MHFIVENKLRTRTVKLYCERIIIIYNYCDDRAIHIVALFMIV